MKKYILILGLTMIAYLGNSQVGFLGYEYYRGESIELVIFPHMRFLGDDKYFIPRAKVGYNFDQNDVKYGVGLGLGKQVGYSIIGIEPEVYALGTDVNWKMNAYFNTVLLELKFSGSPEGFGFGAYILLPFINDNSN